MAHKAYLTTSDPQIGHTFDINPNSVSWAYRQNTATYDTLGGRVVQLLSVEVSTMTVEGDTGSKRALQQLARDMRAVMGWHVQNGGRPAKFKVPSKGWNFRVFVKSFPQIGWGPPESPGSIVFPYRITMEVDEDLGLTTKTILRKELERLKKNVGYDPYWHGGNVEATLSLVQTQDQYASGGAGGGAAGGSVPGGKGGTGEGLAGDSASKKAIKQDLALGFKSVNRGALARMVLDSGSDGEDFDTWVNQESGWNPRIVSGRTNQGMVNGGLFQIWYGHSWGQKYFGQGNSGPGDHFTASAYLQARLIVENFNPNPEEIRGYAQAIRANSYVGWG